MIWEDVEERIERFMDMFDAAPAWLQAVLAFTVMGCVTMVAVQLWYMMFRRVVQVAAVLFVAALVVGRWRWGFVTFVLLAGVVWILRAEHRAAAAMVTSASVLLAGMSTLPPSRSRLPQSGARGISRGSGR